MYIDAFYFEYFQFEKYINLVETFVFKWIIFISPKSQLLQHATCKIPQDSVCQYSMKLYVLISLIGINFSACT